MLLLCVLVAGSSAWATDATYSLTPNQSNTGSSATSYITTLTEFTHSGVSWKMNQWNPSTLQIKANQSSAASEFRFYNTSAFSGRIKQVVITFSALTVNEESKLMFLGGTEEVSGTSGGTAGTWNSTAKTLTWTPAASENFTYFAFYQDGKAASGTNYLASSDAIVVTYESGGPSLTTSDLALTGAPVALSFALPGNSTAQTISYTTSSTGEVTVASSNYATFSINQTNKTITVTPTAVTPNTQTITVNQAADATYDAGSATFTVSVADGRAATTIVIDDSGITNTDVYANTAAGSLSATVKDNNNNAINGATVSWSSSDTGVATIASDGTVTLVAAGTTTITASYAGDENQYKSSSATYELTVTSSAPQPIEISLNNSLFGTSYNGTASGITDEDPVTGTQNNVTVTYAGSGSHYVNNSQIRFYPNNKLTFSVPDGYNITKIVFTADGTWAATISADGGTYTSNTKTWTGSATSVLFTGSGSSRCDMSKATISIVSVGSAVATTTTIDATGITNTNVFNGTAAGSLNASVTKTDGGDTVPNATVTWSGDNDDVATINASTGAVTLVGAGSVTFTATYAGDEDYKSSYSTYVMTVTNENPNAIVLWSEDFSSYDADDVPSGGDFSYACTDGGSDTKIYEANIAGGTSPELLVSKSNGTFTAVVPLTNVSGSLTLKYKQNGNALSVSTTTEGISGSFSSSTAGEQTVTFTGVTPAMTSITIVFKATSSSNVRLDDIVLKGTVEVPAVEAPTFSVEAGTYYTAQSVELNCTTEGSSIYYTLNGNEPTSSSTLYTSAISVATTTTIKAIAIKDNDESAVSSATYTILEKEDAVFVIDNMNLAYEETYTLEYDNDYLTDGTVSLSTSNDKIVSVDNLTITAKAVGTATITVTAAEGETYKSGSTTFTVIVTAPAGGTTAGRFEITTTFTDKDLDYEDGGIDWTASTGANSFESATPTRGVQFGAGVGAFTLTATGSNVTKVSMVVSTNGTGNTIGVSVDGNAFKTTYGLEEGDDAIETLTLASGMIKENVEFTGKAGNVVTISVNDGNKSVYFKSITLSSSITAKLNGSGYATFCSQYPLDFTNASGYSAWQITEVDGTTITFSQITGKVKGGTGILLKGTAGAIVTLMSSDSDSELGGNLLVGTLAPTYAETGEYYGLKGNEFVKVNEGTVPSGKALLPASALGSNPSRQLTFVFDEATGISTVEHKALSSDDAIYSISGQRVSTPKKGLYIVNGKKVLVK